MNGRPIDCDRLLHVSVFRRIQKAAKATIGFVSGVRLIVRPSVRLEELGSQTEEFS